METTVQAIAVILVLKWLLVVHPPAATLNPYELTAHEQKISL
mgnify:CR=1 FL=1